MFAVKLFNDAPQACRFILVGAIFNSLDLFLFVGVCNVVADVYVEFVGQWEKWSVYSVTFENESPSNVDEVGHYV